MSSPAYTPYTVGIDTDLSIGVPLPRQSPVRLFVGTAFEELPAPRTPPALASLSALINFGTNRLEEGLYIRGKCNPQSRKAMPSKECLLPHQHHLLPDGVKGGGKLSERSNQPALAGASPSVQMAVVVIDQFNLLHKSGTW